jgi:hypothetical protein
LQQQTGAVFDAAASKLSVRWLEPSCKKLIQQIAVGAMYLNPVEARILSVLGERGDNPE